MGIGNSWSGIEATPKLMKLNLRKPMQVILIGALIAIIGGVISAIGTYFHNKNSSAKTDRIETGVILANDEINSLHKENDQLRIHASESLEKLIEQSKSMDSLRQENTALYEKLAQKSNAIYQNIIGGDSYCYLRLLFHRMEPEFMLVHEGSNTLRNVHIEIEDYARRVFLWDKYLGKNFIYNDSTSKILNDISNKTHYSFQYQSIYPNTAIQQFPIPIEPGQTEIRMQIWINLENGLLIENLDMPDSRDKKHRHRLEVRKGEKKLMTHTID